MECDYKTIKFEASAELTQKRSRFVANLCPVETVDSAISYYSRIKKNHYSAKHNIYAYILSNNKSKFSDDGEPSGTAGKPVLEILKNKGLSNVIAVVSRYFGGILLGKGGLVRAYSGAVQNALNIAEIVNMTFCSYCKISCTYDLYNSILRLIDSNGGYVCFKEFKESVNLFFYILVKNSKLFKDKLKEIDSNKIKFSVLENKFFNLDSKQKL